MNKYYESKERTVRQVVDEKIKVLEDFYIVDIDNEYTIRKKLIAEIESHPNSDPDVIADRVARTLISNKLYS